MDSFFSSNRKIGILGGGQLGKMLALKAAQWDFSLKVLDPSADAPAAHVVKEFCRGDFRDFDTVMDFGKDCSVITIEIEDVNTDALRQLASKGIKVYPQPGLIELFKNKQEQKKFYQKNQFPTAPFTICERISDVMALNDSGKLSFPLVWKAAIGGYDGRGVMKLSSSGDLSKLPDIPCILESHIELKTEVAVIVHRNEIGELVCQPLVEMSFHPEAHFVEMVFTPSHIDFGLQLKCINIATELAEKLSLVGTLAIEFFITASDEVYINEAAPRVHNSGHLTIEATPSSQFEQHLRAIAGLPLGASHLISPACMINLTGAPGYIGPVKYEGADEVLSIPNTWLHLYGKSVTRPHRKMGHITTIDKTLELVLEKAVEIKKMIKVISQ